MAHASSGAGSVGVLRILLAAWLAIGVAGGAYVWVFHVQPKLLELATSEPQAPSLQSDIPAEPVAPALEPAAPNELPVPSLNVVIERYQPPEQLFVRGTNVRFREQPFATPETHVVRYAEAGELLYIVGRVIQPDGYTWFHVQLSNGPMAFIRSDFTEAAPLVPAPLVPEPALMPEASSPSEPTNSIRTRPSLGSRFRMPDYPAAALRAKEEGDVTVSACVDRSGALSNLAIVQSSGHARLDEATLKHLARTRIEPARDVDGKATDFCTPPHQMTLQWRLQN